MGRITRLTTKTEGRQSRTIDIRLRVEKIDGSAFLPEETEKINNLIDQALESGGYQILRFDTTASVPAIRLTGESLSETGRVMRILRFIKQHCRDKGFSPSIREIGIYTGIRSTSTITYYLDILQRSGHISRDARVARSITVLSKGETNV